MNKRVADIRPQIKNFDDADNVMKQIAAIECRMALAKARVELRIQALKAKLGETVSEDAAQLSMLEQQLSDYIIAHQDQFQKPRKRKCEWGTYGLQSVSEVQILDEAKLVQHALDCGYDEIIKTVHTPVKSAVEERLKSGCKLPGCSIHEGDTAVYKVAKHLIDEAVTTAEVDS